jgi:hypothetical protein
MRTLFNAITTDEEITPLDYATARWIKVGLSVTPIIQVLGWHDETWVLKPEGLYRVRFGEQTVDSIVMFQKHDSKATMQVGKEGLLIESRDKWGLIQPIGEDGEGGYACYFDMARAVR